MGREGYSTVSRDALSTATIMKEKVEGEGVAAPGSDGERVAAPEGVGEGSQVATAGGAPLDNTDDVNGNPAAPPDLQLQVRPHYLA